MKLTKTDKEAFVRAVMADVPAVDYNEVCRALCMAWAISNMPGEVRTAYERFPDYFENRHLGTPYSLSDVWVPMSTGLDKSERAYVELMLELEKLAVNAKRQQAKICDLRDKLKTSIACCNTLKQAQERLPELVSYLPADRENTGIKNLPAVINPIAELTAAGWPKGKKAA